MPYHALSTALGTVLCQTGDRSGGGKNRQDEELTDN